MTTQKMMLMMMNKTTIAIRTPLSAAESLLKRIDTACQTHTSPMKTIEVRM
jgi:hypothetical protein